MGGGLSQFSGGCTLGWEQRQLLGHALVPQEEGSRGRGLRGRFPHPCAWGCSMRGGLARKNFWLRTGRELVSSLPISPWLPKKGLAELIPVGWCMCMPRAALRPGLT